MPSENFADTAITEWDQALSQYHVIRRNGQLSHFDANKIAIAMTKAFLAVEGDTATSSNRIHNAVLTLTNQVVSGISRHLHEEGTVPIEDIQDQVELALMRAGFHKVARAYVLYREEHAHLRAEKTEKTLIYVTDKTGHRHILAEDRLKAQVTEACANLEDVIPEIIIEESLKNLFEGISELDVNHALVMATRTLIEKEPNYTYVAARLLLDQLRSDALDFVKFSPVLATASEMAHYYNGYFKQYIKCGIDHELLDPRLAEFDLDKLGKTIVAERDLQFTYLGLQTLYDRYFLHWDETRFELPQAFFMRVSMGISLNEDNREAQTIEFYNLLSSFDFMSSTPTLFNSGTLRPQLSSCYLTTVSDDLEGIFDAIKDNALLSKFAGGLGNDWTPVRGMGSHIKGTNGKSQGVVPFLKVANDTLVAVNQGGRRRGSGCAYLETWHIDIEEFLELRKNTGDERRRTHDMNTANWIPDELMKRVYENKQWTLFSPNEVPELHELYGEAFKEAYEKYEKAAQQGKVKIWKLVSAVELWRKMLTMLFETGHPWFTFKDACNLRSTQQHVGVVHSSNLCCIAADQRVVTDRGLLTVGELYQLGRKNQVVGLDGIYNASEMLLPRPNAPMVQIETKEGYRHKVTPDHKVWVKDKAWVEAQYLAHGDNLLIQQLEGLWGHEHNPELTYIMGVIAGDANYYNKSKVFIKAWGKDVKCTGLENALEKHGFTPDSKKQVPQLVWQGSRKTVAEYLNGLYQANGNIQSDGEVIALVLVSKYLAFIQELQILWANFGVKTSINKISDSDWSKPLYELSITSIRGCQIAESITDLGSIKNSKAGQQYLANLKKEGYTQKLYATFTGITPLPNEDAYCLTVDSENHAWTVNGLITKNTEITLNTKVNEEIATCNLASVNLPAHIKDGELDIEKLQRTIGTAMRALDNVIDINYYSVMQARTANMRHRPVGLGVMGFQDALYKLRISYASQEAVEFADYAQELISYYAISASSDLAEERGSYSSFAGSLWSQGILPIDSIEKLAEVRGKYLEMSTKSTLDWDSLRERVKTVGMRNSNTMAIAPTACVAGETLILSSEGLVPIETLVAGTTQWQAINIQVMQESNLALSNQLYLNGLQDTLRIVTKQGSAIRGTLNHRLRIIDENGEYVWKYLSEISVGDEVIRCLGGHQELLANKLYMALQIPYKTNTVNQKNLHLPAELTEDVAYLLGLYMMGDSHYLKKEGIGISICDDDPSVIELVRDVFIEKMGITPDTLEKNSAGCTVHYTDSTALVDWFKVNSFTKFRENVGQVSASAFIPQVVLQSRTSVLAAFLRGLFVANGTVEDCQVELCTISKTLAKQVKMSLESLDIVTTLSMSQQSETWDKPPVYRVRPGNVLANKLFSEIVGFGVSWKGAKLKENIANCASEIDMRKGHNVKNTALIVDFIASAKKIGIDKRLLGDIVNAKTNGALNIHLARNIIAEYPVMANTKLGIILSQGNVYFEKVVEISSSRDMTYDLQVPENHTYVANGFVSHNTISNVCGVTQSIEPTYQNLYVKSNLSGEFTIINPYLVRDLKALGLWDDVMINDLKYCDGRIRLVERIPEELKTLYVTAFEIDSTWLVEAASRRQKWIDQAQSLNLYMQEPSGRQLDNLYKLAWLRGLKTTYYLRTMGATRVAKSTVINNPVRAPQVCALDDEECEVCQ